MFKKYDNDNLYKCTINDMIPYYTENICGCIILTGENLGSYETIVYKVNNRYIDINNPKRLINFIDKYSKNMPILSRNSHLYSIDSETLRKLNNYKEEKSLKRVLSISK